MSVTIICEVCGAERVVATGEYNRCIRRGQPSRFCSRACFVAAHPRRTGESAESRRARKSDYDRKRRAKLGETCREDKRAYYLRHHAENLRKAAERRADPEYRERMAAYQREHCRRPEWRKHKFTYDRQRRASAYGEWADAYLAALELRDAALEVLPDDEIRALKGTLNKSAERKRHASSEAQRRRAQGHFVERHRRRQEREAGPGVGRLHVVVGAGDPAHAQGAAGDLLAGGGSGLCGDDRFREAAREPEEGESARGVVIPLRVAGGAA